MQVRRALIVSSLFTVVVLNGMSGSVSGQELRLPSVLVTLVDDIDVAATESGVLTDVGVDVGSLVKSKQLLARIDDVKAGLTVKQRKSELAVAAEKAKNDVKVRLAQKTQAVAKAELNRALESVKIYDSISKSELDALRFTVDKAILDIEQAGADLRIAKLIMQAKQDEHDLAQADVNHRRIVSPIDGIVVDVRKQRGEWVEPGDKILRVIRLDRLRVKGFVKFGLIRGPLKGRPVMLTAMIPGEGRLQFAGTVTYVSPEVDPNNGEVAVWAEIRNPQHKLKPGLRGDLVIDSPR